MSAHLPPGQQTFDIPQDPPAPRLTRRQRDAQLHAELRTLSVLTKNLYETAFPGSVDLLIPATELERIRDVHRRAAGCMDRIDKLLKEVP